MIQMPGHIEPRRLERVDCPLIPPADAKALAERIEWVLDHPAESKAYVEAWRSHAQKEFSLAQTIDKTDALYRSLVKAGANQPGQD